MDAQNVNGNVFWVLNGDGTNWIDQQGIPAIAVLLREYESVDWNNNLAGIKAILDNYAN